MRWSKVESNVCWTSIPVSYIFIDVNGNCAVLFVTRKILMSECNTYVLSYLHRHIFLCKHCRLRRRIALSLAENKKITKSSQLAHTKTDRTSAQCFLWLNTSDFSRAFIALRLLLEFWLPSSVIFSWVTDYNYLGFISQTTARNSCKTTSQVITSVWPRQRLTFSDSARIIWTILRHWW
jgi:hypothetical protein